MASAENPAWLATAIAHAERQATAEARHLWGTRAGAPPPFNYRLEHIKLVVSIAGQLAAACRADAEVVLAAAWLHDVAKAYREEWGDGHGQRGAARARAILLRTDFPAGKVDGVGEAIASHVGLFRDEPPPSVEAAVLYDADKLSKLGVTSTVHFLCSHPAVARQAGQAADTASAAEGTARWLELAPRMVESLLTTAGREMGRQRLDFLRGFVAQLRTEGVLARGEDRGL